MIHVEYRGRIAKQVNSQEKSNVLVDPVKFQFEITRVVHKK